MPGKDARNDYPLRLPNHDWLFFSEQAIPANLQLNSRP
jgi:hypothetical protein